MMVLLIPSVLADYGMMGYGATSNIGMAFYGILWFIIISFVFSVIFWLTYKWIVDEKKQKKR